MRQFGWCDIKVGVTWDKGEWLLHHWFTERAMKLFVSLLAFLAAAHAHRTFFLPLLIVSAPFFRFRSPFLHGP
jgi:hypothetical protein